jgi:type 1 glutamine amidotransferase
MRVGVICDDKYHPADVVIHGLNALNTENIVFDFITDTSSWSASSGDDYDIIVLSKGNGKSPVDTTPWLIGDIPQGFVTFVEQGGGLFVIHSGTVGYRNDLCLRTLIGGGFAHHPAPGPVLVEYSGNPTIPGMHPSTFTVHDEHYLMEMFHDDLEVFLTSTSKDGTQPAGWTRTQGKGKVCVVTPGHYSEVWSHPEYQHILLQALSWFQDGK